MQPGYEQLKDWMRRRGLTQRETATLFGWDETFISRLVSEDDGRRQAPGLATAVKIERITGIPVATWVSSRLDESRAVVGAKSRKRQ